MHMLVQWTRYALWFILFSITAGNSLVTAGDDLTLINTTTLKFSISDKVNILPLSPYLNAIDNEAVIDSTYSERKETIFHANSILNQSVTNIFADTSSLSLLNSTGSILDSVKFIDIDNKHFYDNINALESITSSPTSSPTIHSDNLKTNDLIPGVSFIIGLIILISAFVLLIVFIELCVSFCLCDRGQRDVDSTISSSNRRLCEEDNNNNRRINSSIVSNQLRSSADDLESHKDHDTHTIKASTENIQSLSSSSSSSSSYVIIGDEVTDSQTMDMKTEEETMISTLQASNTQTQSSSSISTFTYYPTTASSSSTGKSTSFSSFLKAMSMKGVTSSEASIVTVGKNSSNSSHHGMISSSSSIVDSEARIQQEHDTIISRNDATDEITDVHEEEDIGEEANDDDDDNEFSFLDILSEFVSIVLPDFEAIESYDDDDNDGGDETIEVDNHHSTLDGHYNGSDGGAHIVDTPSNAKNISSSMNPSTPPVQQQQQQQQHNNRVSNNSNSNSKSIVGFLLHSFNAVTTTTPSKMKGSEMEQSGDSTTVFIDANMNSNNNLKMSEDTSSNEDYDNIDDGKSGLKIDIPENDFITAVDDIPSDDGIDGGDGINNRGYSFLDTISAIIASAIPDYDDEEDDDNHHHHNDDIESNKGSMKVSDTGRNKYSNKIKDDESLHNSRASTPTAIKRTVSFSSESEVILVENESVKKSNSSLLRRLSPTINRRRGKNSSPIRGQTPTKSYQKPKIITK